MPIYEYACNGCGHRFEVFQKMSDAPPSTCPSCNAAEVRKLVSATSFVLKGGGWYKDHYGLKSGGDSKSEGSSTGESSAPAAPSSGESGGSSTPAAPAAPSTPAAAPSTGASSAPAAAKP